jgi:hypothetical protein
MQITFDLQDGSGVREYSNYVVEDGFEIKRMLNRPSQCKLKLLLGTQVPAPQVGAALAVARSNGEMLFTGAAESVEHEYVGWGERGPQYELVVMALSQEAQLGAASVPGGVEGPVQASAGALMVAQLAGAASAADDGGFAEGLQLSAVDIRPQESASAVLASVASQSRLAYRVNDGVMSVQPIGAVTHAIEGGSSSILALAGQANVTVTGGSEAQAYVSEYIVCDETTDLIPIGFDVFGAEHRKVFTDLFAQGTTALTITGPAGAAQISTGLMSINASGATCEVSVGAPIELGGRRLFEVAGITVQSCGSPVLTGLFAGATTIADCIGGFALSVVGGQMQWLAVINGATAGSPLVLNSGSIYTLRVRFYAPEHVRRTQVYHSSKHPANAGLGGRDIDSWLTVQCEIEEQAGNSKTLHSLATQVLPSSPSFATAIVANASAAVFQLNAVRITTGPDFEARYGTSSGERLLRVGAKSDGAEAWVSKKQLRLGWQPQSGDIVKLNYRWTGATSAQGSAAAASSSMVAHVVAPLPRSTEDCENAAAALLEDASDPSANVQGTWSDLSGSIGTNVWPGEAITIDGVTTIIRELSFTPVSMQSEFFAAKLALANEGASPIAIQHRAAAPLSTSVRSVVGTVYAPNLSAVQITAVT